MRKNVISIIITVIALLLLAVALIFQCSPMEDGTYMNCHKANMTVAAISCIIAVFGILSILVKEAVKKQILLGVTAVLSVVNAMIPGMIISLCMMPEMTCRAVLRPVTIGCSLLIFLSALAKLIFVKKVKA